MAVKDYYGVLGVSRDASASGIRSAYRKLAKRYHPDRAGAGDSSSFRNIAEAYDVLSDPEKRRAHNRALADAENRRPVENRRARAPSSPSAPIPEPLDARSSGVRVGIPWAEPSAPLEIAVSLSRREAAQGGVVPFGVPVVRRCSACGRGIWRLLCANCGGFGIERSVERVEIPFPPGVRSGTVIESSLARAGIEARVRLRLFVSGTN